MTMPFCMFVLNWDIQIDILLVPMMKGHAAKMPTLVFVISIQSQSSASKLCPTKVSFMKGDKNQRRIEREPGVNERRVFN